MLPAVTSVSGKLTFSCHHRYHYHEDMQGRLNTDAQGLSLHSQDEHVKGMYST